MTTQAESHAEPIVLDEYGLAIWRHKYSKALFVERPYRWADKVVVLDEADDRRLVVDSSEFSTFNFVHWIPVTVEEHKKIRRLYKDIYR